MPSANGYKLVDDQGREHVAYWPAPYFVFVGSDEPDEAPLGLIHCDDLDHARAVARHGGTILDAAFVALP